MIGASHKLTLLQESQFLLNVLMTMSNAFSSSVNNPFLLFFPYLCFYSYFFFVYFFVFFFFFFFYLFFLFFFIVFFFFLYFLFYLWFLFITPIRLTITIEFM